MRTNHFARNLMQFFFPTFVDVYPFSMIISHYISSFLSFHSFCFPLPFLLFLRIMNTHTYYIYRIRFAVANENKVEYENKPKSCEDKTVE